MAFGAAKATSCSTLDSCNSVGILSMEKSKRKCNPLEDFYAEIFRARYKHVSLMERKIEVAATSSTNIYLKNRLLMFLLKIFSSNLSTEGILKIKK